MPGELTMLGPHLAIQTSSGWDDDHLHVFCAGPFRFAPGYVELDDTVPSELVTMTDLAALGIRELAYRYDLGDCWDHEIVIEKVATGGDATGIECIAGAGTTPAEDGQDWYDDDDGRIPHNPIPAEARVYNLGRINRALSSLVGIIDDG
ncbi:plasmid pRiA4b ORF-3 family protein [Plantactinospora sp. KBS50]|uniref:plasmid pRiA4b ORF-3 family protein n=1 Tax=Plantactinospora sp. KBS50 TaxID=2024580 RepID=UPI001E5E8E67|nr:plasmid pRiA4b ORF-3 family protein [Plantactinospora sp. KBS50]